MTFPRSTLVVALLVALAACKPAANTAAPEAQPPAPAKAPTAGLALNAIASGTDLARMLGENLRADVDPLNATNYATEHLFGLFVAQGLADPTHNMAYLLQGGLGMPNRDYYLSKDPAMVAIRDKYKAY